MDLRTATLQQKAEIELAWRRKFNLSWKFNEAQRVIHAEIKAKRGEDRTALLACRGFGKTFELLVLAVEACLQKPNQQIAFVAVTQKQAFRNINQSLVTIFEDAPPGLRLFVKGGGGKQGVKFDKDQGAFVFPNASKLFLMGTDADRFEDLRGMSLNGCIVDEAQDHGSLDYVVRTVLDPAVLRVNGWFVIAGTVPKDGAHDWITLYNEALALGCAINKTIHDCPRYSEAEKEKFCRRAGGPDSPTWKREYLNEWIFTESRLVVPEWSAASKGTGPHPLVQVKARPTHAVRYVGLDFAAVHDLSAAVFGFWDFQEQCLHIEAEWSKQAATDAEVALGIAATEKEIWEGATSKLERWGDNDHRLLANLKSQFGIKIQPSEKHAKQILGISRVRVLIAQGRLTIDPRCKKLIASLYKATKGKGTKAKQFEHDDEGELGHFDLLDGLIYLTRNVKQQLNPLPPGQNWTYDRSTGRVKPKVDKRYQSLASALGAPKQKPGPRRF